MGGTRCTGDHRVDDADRAGTGDENAGAWFGIRLAVCPDAHRERLHQGSRVEGNVIGNRVREVLIQSDVLRERSIDRRGRKEDHVRAQVVVARAALRARFARDTGLHRDAHAGLELRDVTAHLGDYARCLVAENEWLFNDE